MIEQALAEIAAARGALDRAEALLTQPVTTPPAPPPPQPIPAPFADFRFADAIEKRRAEHVPGAIGEGAYRFVANAHRFDHIDPFVFPGQRPDCHLHMFWGNLEIDEHSTIESLMASGRSLSEGDLVNRSGYWMSALTIGDRAWLPDWVANYYKLANPAKPSSPTQGDLSRIREMPNGLCMIFGNRLGDGTASPHVWFTVNDPKQGLLWHKTTLAGAVPLLTAGRSLIVSVAAPQCWNGELTSDDHRAHLAYPVQSGQRLVCPQTHPFVIPQVTYKAKFTVPPGVDMRALRASSDEPDQAAGASVHAEYMGAHHPEAVKAWHENALLRQLDCSSADFGNGWGGKRHPTFTFERPEKLVPFPSRFDPSRRIWASI